MFYVVICSAYSVVHHLIVSFSVKGGENAEHYRLLEVCGFVSVEFPFPLGAKDKLYITRNITTCSCETIICLKDIGPIEWQPVAFEES